MHYLLVSLTHHQHIGFNTLSSVVNQGKRTAALHNVSGADSGPEAGNTHRGRETGGYINEVKVVTCRVSNQSIGLSAVVDHPNGGHILGYPRVLYPLWWLYYGRIGS